VTTVDQTGLSRKADQDHPASWLDPTQAGGRDTGIVGGVDNGIKGRRQVFTAEVGPVNAQGACQLETGVLDADDMDFNPPGQGELGREKPDRPRTEDQ